MSQNINLQKWGAEVGAEHWAMVVGKQMCSPAKLKFMRGIICVMDLKEGQFSGSACHLAYNDRSENCLFFF